MRAFQLCVLTISCTVSQGCLTYNKATYWTVSGDGTRGTPEYEYDGGGCASSYRPRYMNFQLPKGVIVSYGYGYGFHGHVYVPPGVTARFVDGIAVARADSSAETQGSIVGLERQLFGAADKLELLPTAPLVGWSKDELLQNVEFLRGEGPLGNGLAEILTWNHFEFGIKFNVDFNSTFSVQLPDLEIDGLKAPSTEVTFTKKTSRELILEPCV
jgi:hypothetical protein